MAEQSHSRTILFTAFEPSGDAHAAPVIRALLDRNAGLRIFAMGGDKMAEAGAEIIEHTAGDGTMGLGAFRSVSVMRRRLKTLKKWAKGHRLTVHVPVDSPAANFPVCRAMRKRGARTVHMVAPQLWAWGRWRLGKLRRRTDLVLCLLPFEEEWFRSRRVPARFIGHPAINRAINEQHVREQVEILPQGAPRLAILPGSRTHEVRKNIGLLLKVYTELQDRHANLAGLVAAANPAIAKMIRDRFEILPAGLHVVVAEIDAVAMWCDFAVTVSGTVSLDLTRQGKPMVGVYRVRRLSAIASRLLLRTKHRLLPNIIAGKRIVPEFVPYAGGPMKIVQTVTPFLHDTKLGAKQSAELALVRGQFKNKRPASEAAVLIEQVLDGKLPKA